MTLSGIKGNKTLQNWEKKKVDKKDGGYNGILPEERSVFSSVSRTEPRKTTGL